jgi:hypothetical protein
MTGLLPTNPAWAGKIPLSPPFPKGEGFYLPFAKGGGEGFKKGIF